MDITRRNFLISSLFAAAAFSLPLPVVAARKFDSKVVKKHDGPRKRVIIVGAGLAGLSCAYELNKTGNFEVVILEAQDRPGGRVQTLRSQFSDGLFADAGAVYFPHAHTTTWHYLTEEFRNTEESKSLSLYTILPNTRFLYYSFKDKNGKRGDWPHRDDSTPYDDWPNINDSEKKMNGVYGMLNTYCNYIFDDLKNPESWTPLQLKKLDDMSFLEFLRGTHTSPPRPKPSDGAVALLRTWYEPAWGDLDKVSALFVLRDHNLGLHYSDPGARWFTLRDGMDFLPKAFAAKLDGKIKYNAPVVGIKQTATSVTATYLNQSGGREHISGDYLVCAIPFSTLRHVKELPEFSEGKKNAIQNLQYVPVARVFLQFEERIWDPDRDSIGVTQTDLPIRMIVDSTFAQPGRGGILHSYTSGEQALEIMKEKDIVPQVLEQMDTVYKGKLKGILDSAHCTTKYWVDDDKDPWARGAYPKMMPGEMASLLPHIASREGRIHFAGDHASALPGWMEGALQSGKGVADEIEMAEKG